MAHPMCPLRQRAMHGAFTCLHDEIQNQSNARLSMVMPRGTLLVRLMALSGHLRGIAHPPQGAIQWGYHGVCKVFVFRSFAAARIGYYCSATDPTAAQAKVPPSENRNIVHR